MLPNKNTPHKWSHYTVFLLLFCIGIAFFSAAPVSSFIIWGCSLCFLPVWGAGKGARSLLGVRPPHSEINANTIRNRDFYNHHSDIIKGYKLLVTLNFWTPLEYLKMHGVLFKTPEETFEINPRFGAWIPYLGETSTPSPHASVFGLVIPDEVLPILMHYREIVEADFPPDEKFRRLQKMTADDTNPNWLRHIQYALHGKYSDMAEYWAINDLTSLQGVGPAKARKLIGRGIYTADQILQ